MRYIIKIGREFEIELVKIKSSAIFPAGPVYDASPGADAAA